jgi:hypothetical protein
MSIHIDPGRTPDRPKRTKIVKGVQNKSVPAALRHPCIPASAPCADFKLLQVGNFPWTDNDFGAKLPETKQFGSAIKFERQQLAADER